MNLVYLTSPFYRYLFQFFIGDKDNRYMVKYEIECHQGNDDDGISSVVGSENCGN